MKIEPVMLRRSALALGMVLALESLGGCAAVQQARTQSRAMEQDARAHAAQAMPQSRPTVENHAGAWLMGEQIIPSKPQPAILDKQVVFNVSNVASWSMSDFTDWLSRHTGVSVIVDDSAKGALPGSAAPSMGLPSPIETGPRVAGLPSLPMLPNNGAVTGIPAMPSLPSALSFGAAAAPALTADKPLRYTGPLRGFLDLITGRAGVYWHYRNGAITIFRTETRTWNIPSLPMSSSSTGSISTGSTGGGSSAGGAGMSDSTLSVSSGSSSSGSASSGGGGSTSMNTTAVVNYWGGLQKTAQAVAGPGAATVVDQSFGTLTVTGTPPQLERVASWVNSLRSSLQKLVAIEVHVYNVKVNREDNYGLNLGLAYNTAYQGSNSAKVSITPAQAPALVSSSTPMSLGASIVGGTLGGTNIAVQALSTLGNVSQVVSRSGVTLNGQMLALQAAQTQNYLASSQTTLTSVSGSSTALQPGTITYGFTGMFLPKVVNGKILIDLNMTLSNLLGISTFTSGSSSIQLPSLSSTTFQQSVSLQSGQTLVLTGYRQQQASVTNNGVGSPDFAALGGGVDAQKGESILAVVITARLL